ncbi:MAG: RecX family transcriptional regulator [Clostridia bacterium]|nr:RecX family transcriptional regulator [Clostridia bacterium]
MLDYEKLAEYDKNKTKVLKYVVYKKRTENEIRRKFEKDIDSSMLEDIIQELKENNYISDNKYIERAVNEFIALRNLSLKQIKYKLLSKGINSNLIEEYFYNNKEELAEYEINSANNIINKKNNNSAEEIIQILLKKGFEYDNVKEALERRNQ